MDALTRSQRVVVLATKHEHEAWSSFAQARGMKLGPCIRLMINNATGVNDPPELDAFTDAELAGYARMTVSEGDLRKLLHEERPRSRRLSYAVGTGLLLLAADVALQLGGLMGYWHL